MRALILGVVLALAPIAPAHSGSDPRTVFNPAVSIDRSQVISIDCDPGWYEMAVWVCSPDALGDLP